MSSESPETGEARPPPQTIAWLEGLATTLSKQDRDELIDVERLPARSSDLYHPIRFDEARELVLPVSDELPEEAHKLRRHYRQRTRRPSVEFIPVSHKEPDNRDPWNRAMGWLQNNRHF